MKNRDIHYKIYSFGFIISLIFISLFFIDYTNPWCILSCSIGASLIGAVVLGLILDLSNSKNKRERSERIFQIANNQLYSLINSLMMVLYHPISEFYKVKKDGVVFHYDDLNIKDLFEKYIQEINEIKTFIVPVISENGEYSSEDMVFFRKQEKVKNIIKEYKESVLDFKNQFKKLWEKTKDEKSILLINDSSFETDIFKIIELLNILSYDSLKFNQEFDLIELGDRFQELNNCNLLEVLNQIGFENVRFRNIKGYFDLYLIQE